jgi:hypothetical protein
MPGPQKRGTGGTLIGDGKSQRDRGHPPMEAGISNQVWSVEDLVGLLG